MPDYLAQGQIGCGEAEQCNRLAADEARAGLRATGSEKIRIRPLRNQVEHRQQALAVADLSKPQVFDARRPTRRSSSPSPGWRKISSFGSGSEPPAVAMMIASVSLAR
jgi:hypothetical protein